MSQLPITLSFDEGNKFMNHSSQLIQSWESTSGHAWCTKKHEVVDTRMLKAGRFHMFSHGPSSMVCPENGHD